MNQLRGHPSRANVRKMCEYGWDFELEITIPTEKWHVYMLDLGCKTHPPSTSVTRKLFDMAPFFGWEKCWMNLEHPMENFLPTQVPPPPCIHGYVKSNFWNNGGTRIQHERLFQTKEIHEFVCGCLSIPITWGKGCAFSNANLVGM